MGSALTGARKLTASLCILLLALSGKLLRKTYPLLTPEPGREEAKVSIEHDSSPSESKYQQQSPLATGDFSATSNECAIYMAPTSLKGGLGMGIYTTKATKEGDLFLRPHDGLSIPIQDYYNHPDPYINNLQRKHFFTLFKAYWWTHGMNDQIVFEADRIADYQNNFGSLPNHHCILASLHSQWPYPYYDSHGLASTPGAGAISYHRGRDFASKRDMEAGEEIFLNYGHCDMDEKIPEGSWYGQVVRTHHYNIVAKALLRAYNEQLELNHSILLLSSKSDEESMNDYWKQTLVTLDANAESDLIRVIIPSNLSELRHVLTKGPDSTKALDKEQIRLNLAKYVGSVPRTPEWVQEHGLCLDNIVPMRSTLPLAGQGAFAKRSLANNELIVPVPLLHIMHPAVLEMYREENGKYIGKQLLMNYCMGHPESTLLFCPQTNAQLVNHCSNRTRECDENGPNAYLRWSSGWDPTTPLWLNRSIEDLHDSTFRGLAMELVALRDIEEGGEIFIDYGEDWEKAWAQHLSSWRPPMDNNWDLFNFTTSNNLASPPAAIVSSDLRASQVTIAGIGLPACYFKPSQADYNKTHYSQLDQYSDWKSWSDEDILKWLSRTTSVKQTQWEQSKQYQHARCVIIEESGRYDDGKVYTVRIDVAPSKLTKKGRIGDTEWEKRGFPLFLTDFPASSIRYFNAPYTSDVFLPNAFRHPMGVRDDIFPVQWKNRKRYRAN